MEKLISIVGLTSSGKSDLAISLALKFGGEIVSADSRQVYKGLDFCSGKVSQEEQTLVPHHLLDVAHLGEQFTLYEYQTLAYAAIDDILKRNKVPFLVGGTGLYSRSVVEGYVLGEGGPDNNIRAKLDEFSVEQLCRLCSELGLNYGEQVTKRRIIRILEKSGLTEADIAGFEQGKPINLGGVINQEPASQHPRYQVLQIGIMWDREKIYERIRLRLEKRMPHMIEEIKSLLGQGISKDFLKGLGLEAKCVTAYLCGEYADYEAFFEDLYKQERHFAKRQQTWYNKEKDIVWLNAEDNLVAKATELVQEFLNKKG